MKRAFKAIQIFYNYDKLENRLPTKEEFDKEWYGKKLRRGVSNYYYQVKRMFLEEGELNVN